ncbi:L-histidine N(alpha)-methyltransferase [Methylacidimicrobium sp. B4]|uniref:L-histidine N(alpha)-methyltransferase n=1 Tax=Methylacidimicrobium sp. B4 TaxID=2796139 RepID=UPI001A8FA92A|nr:L-histidine N(alpha)-methyltransferase [Methylacidimicrobium sp. B4]QSR84023.1 L-histidine N(alpha)-methyltransferase [Methylacidimicrobium sp. B4]
MKNGFTKIEVAESHLPSAWLDAKRASLEKGEIAPPFHYATARQANLWMALFHRYSPFSAQEGKALYLRMARDASTLLAETPAQLVSLGCGTAEKDLLLYGALRARSWRPDWICVDGSLSLLLEAGRVSRSDGEGARLILADVFLPALFDRLGRPEGRPRLVTAFGLIPNVSPELFLQGLRAQLLPCDRLLLGANLAPVATESTQAYRESAERILPQYANRSTELWLTELLRDWGLRERVEGYAMGAVERDGWIRYEATVRWKRSGKVPLEDGSSLPVRAGSILRLFSSYRFTREGIGRLLRTNGFESLSYWTVPSGEEGVWLVAPSSSGTGRMG